MNKIEDVIKAYECKKSIKNRCNECPYITECDDKYHCECEARDNDTLHYLKAYRSDQLEWEANRKAWDLVEEDLISARMKYIAKLKELGIGTLNNPLTWDGVEADVRQAYRKEQK